MTTVFHLVNGILNFPGDSKNWTGRGVTHLMSPEDSQFRAEKIEYWCGPISRAFGQRKRARKFKRTLEFYQYHKNIVVAHSNGADVVVTALKHFNRLPHIHHLHLVSAACNADFAKNGLNTALRSGRIGYVTVYVAGKDQPLRYARTWFGSLLGYGTLGLAGPLNVADDIESRVRTVPRPHYGHSTWWHDKYFDATMAEFTHLQ